MAQSSSAAASTSTSTAPNSDHDVFINHRGPDVKKKFASHLYRRLQSYGLRVFLDQPELQRGDYIAAQIEEAIRYASVHVAIFSSGYAESTWCLRELVLMLQSNSPVIPVFYEVKPKELRWTRGKEGGYAKALEELEKKTSTDPQTGEEKLRYDPSLIQNWRNALFEAAGISGFELEACNGDEGELVDNVVEEVLKRVKKPVLNVARALEELAKKTSTDPQTGEEKLWYDPSLIQNWRNALSKAAGISGFELEACNGDEGELVYNVVEEELKRLKKPVSNSDYDVFINHRGRDVKKTFASHLYRRLQSYGLRVFLDEPELRRGEYLTQIEGVIGSASVHVAIFSSGYAESTWCLLELVLMLQSNSPVIPVFHSVKPEELWCTRGKKGGYAKALEGLEKKTLTDRQTGEEKSRYDPSLIENWRNALSKAAVITGFELEACNGDEGELVDNVVKEVLKRVKKPVLNVAKYPTGLDDKVTDFENTVILPLQHAGKPQIVGIVGLGGVGKTTLAKELFNRKSSGYRRCCFLADVRDKAGKGSLNSLQKELLVSLTGWDMPIDNVHQGKAILKRHISSPNLLVILDDVDEVDQVDELLPDQTVLHSDSLILITSRSKDVLRRSGVEESSIYNLTGLSTEQSLELFCLYSFNQSHPLPGFESLAKKFIEPCGGLPLSLKVFGALLNRKEVASYWEAQLDKLQRILPEEIKQKLQISYDALDREDQKIFLDIACFLIGEDRDRVIRICDGSGRKGSLGFGNLENKCLVEVNSANKIRMHDHLRDMGREIADASLPRRLWRSTEKIDDLLQQSSVINEVRGIRSTDYYSSVMPLCQRNSELFWHCFMKLCNKQYPFHGSGICMRNLQLLHTGGVLGKRILTKVQFPNLVWLRWDNCPYSSLHSSISYMKNLRVLQVEGSKLKTLWKKESQAPLQLRELEIKAPLSSIPKSIGKLTQLERIVICRYYEFAGKVTVTQLPEEFCFLQSLKALELEGFSEMKSLPERFGELTNLRQISLSRCSAMKSLPERFGELANLQQISLSGCSALKRLPDSLGNLANLHHIDLSFCFALERLPDSFCKLNKLQHLDLSHCINLTMSSETLGNVSTLLYINLRGCRKVEVLPPQVPHQVSLRELFLTDTNIKELPSAIGELHDLEVLEVGALLEVLPPSLCSLKSLKVLRLYDCKELKCLPASLGDLRNLKKLRIECCRELKSLPASLGRLAQLTELWISGCPLIRELPFLPLSDLESSIDHCILPRLQKLDLSGIGISEVSFAEGVCSNLRELIMGSCNSVVEVGTLPNTLQSLDITDCIELEELPCIETLVSLRMFWARRCVKLKGIRGLGQLTELEQLDVYGCSELEEVEGIQHGMSLETVDARECPKLQWDAGVVEQLHQRMGSAFDYDYRRGCLEQLRQRMGSALECFAYFFVFLRNVIVRGLVLCYDY